jgi:hypothetical protein
LLCSAIIAGLPSALIVISVILIVGLDGIQLLEAK